MKLVGFSAENLMFHDGIPFAAERGSPAVERDENGVPSAWRIFVEGENSLTKNGEAGTLTLDAEDMASIITHHRTKGAQIPLDCRHYLHEFASRKHLDEADVLKLVPDGTLAMGFGSLALRGEELWMEGVKWNPVAYEIMRDKQFKYFSPAVRGLVTPPLRITSVALENEPCLNHLDALAASAESRKFNPHNGGKGMNKKLMQAVAALLGRDSLALEGEADQETAAAAVESKAGLIKSLRTELKLADDVPDAAIAAALKGAIEKAGGYDAVKAELDSLKLSGETAKCEDLIGKAVGEGKIPRPEQQAYARSLSPDSLALGEYLKQMPVEVPVGQIPRNLLPPGDPGDNIELTAEDRKAIARLGLDEAAYKKQKKSLFNGGK